jgi:hypothetical protein
VEPRDRFAREQTAPGRNPLIRDILSAQLVANEKGPLDQGPWELRMQRTASGFQASFKHPVDRRGVFRLVEPGYYTVRLVCSAYQPVEVRAKCSAGSELVTEDFLPAASYAFPLSRNPETGFGPTLLRGVVRDDGREPVSGAQVKCKAARWSCETDIRGQWVLAFNAGTKAAVEVAITAPDGSSRLAAAEVLLREGQTNSFPGVS